MRKLLLAGIATLAAANPAFANVTISDPGNTYQAGIGPNGELYDNNTGVGLRNPDGDDYIQPGTPRDSWGVTTSNGDAYADYQQFGTSGIISSILSSTANSATITSVLNSGLTLRQDYNFFAPNILSIQETLTNTGLAVLTGIVFRRNVDLDIPPNLFNENVFGVIGSNASVVANSYFGFENPNPSVAYGFPCGPTCNERGDLGAGIDFGVGTLGLGESSTFAYYYGINQPGQNLDQLFAQAQGLGLNYLIGAQSIENGDYPNLGARSAFLGISARGTVAGAVPEPATWLMMILGFGFVGGAMRYRKRSTSVSFASA